MRISSTLSKLEDRLIVWKLSLIAVAIEMDESVVIRFPSRYPRISNLLKSVLFWPTVIETKSNSPPLAVANVNQIPLL